MRAGAEPIIARVRQLMSKTSLLLAMTGVMTLGLAASHPSLSVSAAKPAVEKPAAATALLAPAASLTPAQARPAGAMPANERPLKPVGEKKAVSADPAAASPAPAVTAKREAKTARPAKEKERAAPPLPPISARRDPFRNPMLLVGVTVNLPPGKAGLIIAQLRVDGIVRAPNGMLAVVTNTSKRTYFLREGDQLYDGSVQKIGPESVTFQENSKDLFGRAITREVVKRLYPTTAGEEK